MQRTIRGSVAAALIGALALSAIDVAPARAAATKQQKVGQAVTLDFSARRRHHRYRRSYRSNRAALRAFGIFAGTIANIAAAEAARRDCRYYGDCYYYYPPPRRYYYRRYYRYRYYHRPRRGFYFYFRY